MTSTLIIIPAAIRDSVNQLIAARPEFPGARESEFTVPVFASGDVEQETPTHYWLCHRFTPEQRAMVAQIAAGIPSASVFDYDMATEPGKPAEILAALGLATKRSSFDVF